MSPPPPFCLLCLHCETANIKRRACKRDALWGCAARVKNVWWRRMILYIFLFHQTFSPQCASWHDVYWRVLPWMPFAIEIQYMHKQEILSTSICFKRQRSSLKDSTPAMFWAKFTKILSPNVPKTTYVDRALSSEPQLDVKLQIYLLYGATGLLAWGERPWHPPCVLGHVFSASLFLGTLLPLAQAWRGSRAEPGVGGGTHYAQVMLGRAAHPRGTVLNKLALYLGYFSRILHYLDDTFQEPHTTLLVIFKNFA